jgi:hypothetical protein
MRLILRFAALLLIVAIPAGAQAADRSTDVPRIVTAGFAAYESKGSRAALAAWLEGSPVSNPATTEQMVASLAPVEAAYGNVIGHETLRVVPVSASVRRVYGIIRYERGPLFIAFDCYWTGKDWIIPMFLTNTKAAEILPASLLAGER